MNAVPSIETIGGWRVTPSCMCALVVGLLLDIAASEAFAVDVPFKIDDGSMIVDGVGKLENGRLTGQASRRGRPITISGHLQGDNLSIEIDGALINPALVQSNSTSYDKYCTASASATVTAGKVAIPLNVTCGAANIQQTIYLDLPAAPTAASAGAVQPAPALTTSTTAPAATLPPIDPIEDTYVAIRAAKVRETPDVTAARVTTIETGAKIYVMGKLKGQDWYLVSENDKPIGYVAADQLVPESQYHPAVASAVPVPATIAPAPAPSQSAIPPALANLDFGRYEALVIGNDNYQNGLPALKTAAGDAQAVAQTLKAAYGFKVTVLLNATRAQIMGALARYRQTLTWDDNLLIYYAGHGSFDQAGDQGYWLPVDAAPDDPTDWVSNTDITTMLKAIQARHVMVVADSCYSGTLTRDANVGIKDADYIQRIVQKKARTVMTSGGLEPVADSGGSGHSVFASAFIAALQQNSGVMDAQSFFAKVREPVVLAAPQTPEYSNLRFAGHEGGDFVFVRKP